MELAFHHCATFDKQNCSMQPHVELFDVFMFGPAWRKHKGKVKAFYHSLPSKHEVWASVLADTRQSRVKNCAGLDVVITFSKDF